MEFFKGAHEALSVAMATGQQCLEKKKAVKKMTH